MKWPLGLIACSTLLVCAGNAQSKPIPQNYANDILQARSVAVVAYSDSDLPVADPTENERARLDVQAAMQKWGKYLVTRDTTMADLIIVMRKGRAQTSTVHAPNGAPPIIYPSDSGVQISVHGGPQNPPLSRTERRGEPHAPVASQVGSADDLLEVYLGGTPAVTDAGRKPTRYPLDEPPVWFYLAKDALKPPKVEAVAVFRKAVEEAEKKNANDKKKP